MVGDGGCVSGDDGWEDVLVDVACWEVGFEPVGLVLVRIVVGEAVLFLELVVFVVAGVNR